MAETPTGPNSPGSPAKEEAGSESPALLDLTSNDSPSSAAPKVQIALEEAAALSGVTVREVKLKAGIGKTEEYDSRSRDDKKDATYAPRDRAQDSARQIITLWLIGLFCVLIVLAFASLFMVGLKRGFDGDFFDDLKTLLDVLLGPVITLLSSAIGFYFGYQQGASTLNHKRAPDDGIAVNPERGQ